MIRWFWRSSFAAAIAVVAALCAAPAALASTPFVDIHSAGPLSDIYIGNDLSCQVQSGGFSSTEYFPNAPGPGDCGTFLYITPDNASGLWGPDFGNHAGGTHTTGQFTNGETPFTPLSQSMTGSGTVADPYRVTTVVSLTDGNLVLDVSEVDSYVVGDNLYGTDITVTNASVSQGFDGGDIYHAADCQLRGSDTGLGAYEPNDFTPDTAACTPNTLGNPPSGLEEFVPITANDDWLQTTSPAIWNDVGTENFPDECLNCRGNQVNNAEGIEYPVPTLSAGQSAPTISFETEVVDTVPTGGLSFTGAAGAAVGGTVATITDPNTSATASAYSATINWGDDTSSTATISGGNGAFNVAGNHTYSAAGTYPISVTITSVGTNQGSSTVSDSATIAAAPTPPPASTPTTAPTPVITGAPTVAATTAGFSGSVNPSGLPTTALFQYGLDPKYTGGGPVVYTNSTPAEPVGSDSTSHTVSASVTGLVPNALYHVRLLASNSAGTTVGPDVTFSTLTTPAPGPPALGKTVNVSVVSGVVLIEVNGHLVPLTELRQIPTNTVIDALRGTIKLTTALNEGTHARDAAAKGKKRTGKTNTQTGTFGGAIFKITQAHSGLANLSLVEGAFSGAPSYANCQAHASADASAAALSSKTLQLLHANAHGKFSTTGRYSAATVRGTKWTVADKCNGTLTHDITDSVVVTDFVHRRTIVLHAGQSYLAKAPRHT